MLPRRKTAIDLFAGAGGLSVGLVQAGYSVVAAVELESRPAATYRANHPEVVLFEQDIRNVSAKSLLRRLGLKKGELDLLAGCPPCQGFSRLSTRNGGTQKNDGRNDLVFEFARLVAGLHPRAFMMENVPGLARDSRFGEMARRFRRLGYDFCAAVLDASDFGVPQRRSRLIVVGARDGVVVSPAAPAASKVTVREALASLAPAGKSGDYLHDWSRNHSPKVQKLIRRIPHDGGSRRDLPKGLRLACHQRSDGFGDVYGRMCWSAQAPTITSGCTNPSKGRFLHPVENRAISLREASILQGFPSDYVFIPEHGREAIAEMIGNALPPPFIAAHAAEISRALDSASEFSHPQGPMFT